MILYTGIIKFLTEKYEFCRTYGIGFTIKLLLNTIPDDPSNPKGRTINNINGYEPLSDRNLKDLIDQDRTILQSIESKLSKRPLLTGVIYSILAGIVLIILF